MIIFLKELYAFIDSRKPVMSGGYDYYLVKKSNLNNKDIFSLDPSGTYFYSNGWHIKGIYSLIIGFIFAAGTIWNENLMYLQSYSWIIGAFISSLTYYLLASREFLCINLI